MIRSLDGREQQAVEFSKLLVFSPGASSKVGGFFGGGDVGSSFFGGGDVVFCRPSLHINIIMLAE